MSGNIPSVPEAKTELLLSHVEGKDGATTFLAANCKTGGNNCLTGDQVGDMTSFLDICYG